ncbi:1,4-dihydroxy-2-naphthoate octaprenyltransferase [Bacteroides sp. KH569_7]|uniref:1,4-dihydroxy-2-naphthoate octaprenyltransferase n=1 Tax=Bacteroides muris (ex Fokt et al. 2023) TaxID=2937417 RepID=A0A9X2NXF1_9BACE|nr:1,4-dihydroxy-2-naphthoate octaprenyltransferase [Bacteroides muris (ex Fokt et al. 2023)]MCR6507983.1 1,4-dihydroxy-2-naphthoate octaprenyltransferase [Bacteroides muris (ex Fokt et al. 2023)]
MNEIKQNSPYAWFLAARPKTLTGAIIPVLLGSALAFSDGQFKTAPALLCALFACGMQIAANFINDLFDFQKGTDRREDRLGPQRACAEGWITPATMKIGIVIALTLSCLAGLAVLSTVWGQLPHGGWELVVLGVVCILFAFLYTTLLSYRGWGDVLVLVFFGFVPVCGTYYVQAYTLNMDVLVLSLVSGLAIDTLLMVNNYRDREQDAVSGKCTLVVRYGKKFGENMYLALGIAAVLLCFWFVYTGKLTPLEFIWAPCVYLYMHALTWRKMIQIGSGKKLNSILGETSRNMLFLGLLLAVALN